MTFYERVKGLCEQQGVSITAMIVALGFSKSAATTWKNSKKMPRPSTIKKVADYLGVTIAELKTGIAEPIDYDNVDTSDFNQPLYTHFLDKYKGDEKQAIRAYLEFEKAQEQDASNDAERIALYQNFGENHGVIRDTHAPVTIHNGTERTLSDQESIILRIFAELDGEARSKVILYAAKIRDKK